MKFLDPETPQLPIPQSDSFPSAIPVYSERFPVDVWSHLLSCLTTRFALMNLFTLLHMHRYDRTSSANASQDSDDMTSGNLGMLRISRS